MDEMVDMDHTGDPVNRKRMRGYIVFLDGDPVSWSIKKQNIVAN